MVLCVLSRHTIMNPIKISNKQVMLELSKEELRAMGNALNEVCNGIEVWEFDTRMGVTILLQAIL